MAENDIFGEISTFYGCQTTATVVGLNYALMGTLSSFNFKLLATDFPDLKEAFKQRVINYKHSLKRKFL